eukprot:jgi/Mesvir1/21882/Mv01951-RA.1
MAQTKHTLQLYHCFRVVGDVALFRSFDIPISWATIVTVFPHRACCGRFLFAVTGGRQMRAIRRKLPKQFEEPPASAVNHLDEIPRRAERVHKRKATLPDYWWHVEYVAGTSALPADEKATGLLRTRELLRTQMTEDGDPEDDQQKSAVKSLQARIKTRLELARKAEKTEAERSAGGHPVQAGCAKKPRVRRVDAAKPHSGLRVQSANRM